MPSQFWVVPAVAPSLLYSPQPGGRSFVAVGEGDGRLEVGSCLLVEREGLFILEGHLIANCQVQLEEEREEGEGERGEEGEL